MFVMQMATCGVQLENFIDALDLRSKNGGRLHTHFCMVAHGSGSNKYRVLS